jgi:hypothetical protein
MDGIRPPTPLLFPLIFILAITQAAFADDTADVLELDTAVAVPENIDANVETQKIMRLPQWVGFGLSVVGIGVVSYGILQNSEHKKLHNEYNKGKEGTDFDAIWEKAENVREKRNISYIVGGTLLSSGIFIYFVF